MSFEDFLTVSGLGMDLLRITWLGIDWSHGESSMPLR